MTEVRIFTKFVFDEIREIFGKIKMRVLLPSVFQFDTTRNYGYLSELLFL